MADAVYYGGGTGVHRASGWAIAEGIILVIIGLFAMFAPAFTGIFAATLLPFFLLIKGIAEIIVTVRERAMGGSWWHALFGIVSILAAVFLFARPAIAVISLVAILIGYLLIDGVVRIAIAYQARHEAGWGWVLTSGVLSLILGLFLLSQQFTVTILVIGFLLGLNIFMAGVVMIARGTADRGIQRTAGTA